MGGGGHTVLDVGDAPLAVEGPPVVAAVAGRSPIVDVDHGNAARRPVEQRGLHLTPGLRGGATVGQDQERGQLTVGTTMGGIRRRVVEPLRGGGPIGTGGERDPLRLDQIPPVELDGTGGAHHGAPRHAITDLDRDDLDLVVVAPAGRDHRRTRG